MINSIERKTSCNKCGASQESVQQKLHNAVVHLKMHPNGFVRLAMRRRQWKSFLYDRGQPKRGLDGVYITPRGANRHEPCCLFLRSLNDNVGWFSPAAWNHLGLGGMKCLVTKLTGRKPKAPSALRPWKTTRRRNFRPAVHFEYIPNREPRLGYLHCCIWGYNLERPCW